ncbi:P-loop containing nucleoside triphosphate hydrolase [Pyrrhoderma noxium]|uniref:P-loop containing nucleoside triphosphate hydrolase n=1 Tax=Pyrrhoderma noxium TaxID=2282107 RepID=A0A286UDH8_9AGAM|nr:P-loop containing nucleoside triphosphate hydrolase [Pyrrhoderma noxium]
MSYGTKRLRNHLGGASKQSTGKKTLKPLSSVSRPPIFQIPGKGKEKALIGPERDTSNNGAQDATKTQRSGSSDKLWVEMFEPQTEGDLAVHKRKVEEVRRWFQEVFSNTASERIKKYCRILVLTGSAGTAKTTTVKVLARELGISISEWRNSLEGSHVEGEYEQSQVQRFESFLSRATSCRSLLGTQNTDEGYYKIPDSGVKKRETKQVVLLEDIPNILHRPTQEAFHTALENYAAEPFGAPIVIIISDASTRGQFRDERLASGSYSSHDIVDIRSVLPASLIHGPYVTQIAFNPIAPTLMLRSLQNLLAKIDIPSRMHLTKDELNLVVESSNGDIRSAIMALQFAYVFDDALAPEHGSKSKKKNPKSTVLMEAITRREQALALFHLMGRILYNKRKGDPPSSSATQREKIQERDIDLRIKDPPPPPPWLSEHRRRTSRVNVEALYSDSPIDTGLFALYLHQNYTQFCNGIDECSDLSEYFSWIDSNGGEQWYQANPHQFHLLTLSTLHYLPSPVPRKGQKFFKPDFFDIINRTHDAGYGVDDVLSWLKGEGYTHWSRSEIAMEMGTVLRLKSQKGVTENGVFIPRSHSAFSTLTFMHNQNSRSKLIEDNVIDEQMSEPLISSRAYRGSFVEQAETESWLSNDDIEES